MKSIKLKNEGSLLLAKNEVRADTFSGSLAVFQLAERVGFEPTRRSTPLPDFESGAFNRSATSPFYLLYFIPYFIEKAF